MLPELLGHFVKKAASAIVFQKIKIHTKADDFPVPKMAVLAYHWSKTYLESIMLSDNDRSS